MAARHKAPRIQEQERPPDWNAALETLLRDGDGAPLADALRRVPSDREGRALLPRFLLVELANLLDPHSTWNT